MVGARAGIVVTGTEVLTGRTPDRNGPFLAERLREQGVDVAQVVVVGDRPDDLAASLAFLAGTDLIITSGGLGPTADDLTAQVVAEFQGRPLRLEPELERDIAAIVARLSAGRGWRVDPEATAAGTRKQAMVPVGASVLAPTGTAPGLVVPAGAGRSGPPVVVLPGPPRELQAMWPAAMADPAVRQALADRAEIRQRTVRLFDVPESELAAMLRAEGPTLAGLEISTCLQDGELEVVTRYGPAQEAQYQDFRAALARAYPVAAFALDGQRIDELVAGGLTGRGLTLAVAESCTAGRLTARLAERPGASAYLLGGISAYADRAKQQLLDVPEALLARHGAVSAEVAAAMADGARRRFAAAVGVGITGVAGPGGGSAGKPVGLVHLCVTDGQREQALRVQLPGGRTDVQRRAVVAALHLIREFIAADGQQ